MRRAAALWLLLALFTRLAVAEEATRRFPVDQRFSVAYLNGKDAGAKLLSLTIRRDQNGKGYRGGGFAGCNTWTARIEIDGDRLAVKEVGTTRKFCHGERMRTENEFLTTLRSLTRWHMDGPSLVLTGGGTGLLLVPSARAVRT